MKRPQYEQMLGLLRAAYPLEGCGFLAGRAGNVCGVYGVENQLRSAHAFLMEPRQQIDAYMAFMAQGWDLLAIFHSHPHGPATPSPDDIAQWAYRRAALLIVSLQDPERPSARAFQLVAERVEEFPLQVQP